MSARLIKILLCCTIPSTYLMARSAPALAQADDFLIITKPEANVFKPRMDGISMSDVTGAVTQRFKPDESALRYYAQSGQLSRVEIEMRRLQRLYPDWQPPRDLMANQTATEDEEDFWTLYAADRFDELAAMIAERRKLEPGWNPSADLMSKIKRRQMRLRVQALAKSGDVSALAGLYKSNQVELDENDVELEWILAESLARTQQQKDALEVYKFVLTNVDTAPERLATIQKAISLLPMSQVEQLLALGNSDSISNEFDPIRIDITRARIVGKLRGDGVKDIDSKAWNEFLTFAKVQDQPGQIGLSAWYLYQQGAFKDALDYFKLALDKGGDAQIAHGLALSLQQVGQTRESEEVAYAWRQALPRTMMLYVDLVATQLTKENPDFVEPERLKRFGQVVMDHASGEGAQALGWYAYKSCQFESALQWFQRATAWHPSETAVFGYALSLQRLKKNKEWLELANRYDGLFAKVTGMVFANNEGPSNLICDQSVASRTAPPASVAQARDPLRPQFMGQQLMSQPLMGQISPFGSLQPSLVDYRPADGMSANGDPRRTNFASVPQPNNLSGRAGGAAVDPLAKLNPKEFPVATNPENDLRFNQTGTDSSSLIAPSVAYRREPFAGPYSPVARRVPGIGTMPYERFGFALLPAFNGETRASFILASDQLPTKGTRWALEPQRGERPDPKDLPNAKDLSMMPDMNGGGR